MNYRKEDLPIFQTEILVAISDETRQEILLVLRENEELSAGAIAKLFSLSRPNISHHLQILKRAKLVQVQKHGTEIRYSLNREMIRTYFNQMHVFFSNHDDEDN